MPESLLGMIKPCRHGLADCAAAGPLANDSASAAKTANSLTMERTSSRDFVIAA
jgi:hypothetical protein